MFHSFPPVFGKKKRACALLFSRFHHDFLSLTGGGGAHNHADRLGNAALLADDPAHVVFRHMKMVNGGAVFLGSSLVTTTTSGFSTRPEAMAFSNASIYADQKPFQAQQGGRTSRRQSRSRRAFSTGPSPYRWAERRWPSTLLSLFRSTLPRWALSMGL